MASDKRFSREFYDDTQDFDMTIVGGRIISTFDKVGFRHMGKWRDGVGFLLRIACENEREDKKIYVLSMGKNAMILLARFSYGDYIMFEGEHLTRSWKDPITGIPTSRVSLFMNKVKIHFKGNWRRRKRRPRKVYSKEMMAANDKERKQWLSDFFGPNQEAPKPLYRDKEMKDGVEVEEDEGNVMKLN